MAGKQPVLVTGGAGYVGAQVCKALARSGFLPVTYDNLVYGHKSAVRWGPLEIGDVTDSRRLTQVVRSYQPVAALHFAAFAYVGESVTEPEKYYHNNVYGSLNLLRVLRDEGVSRFVFSSSCATYGIPSSVPILESHPQRPVNPYGASKLMVERILADFEQAYGLRSAILRYFNAAGADSDGEIGELHEPETHAVPLAILAALGKIKNFEIYGTDYATPDGTAIRDYIHVEDLASGHILALQRLLADGPSLAVNLGTGRGHSVKELLACVERASDRTIPVKHGPRRAGDPPELIANPTLAKEQLGWSARYGELDPIVESALRWHLAQDNR